MPRVLSQSIFPDGCIRNFIDSTKTEREKEKVGGG
jgi:hypothetical protein